MHGQGNSFAYGMWPVVAFNILVVLFFAFSFVKPKQPIEWRSMGLFIAFIVALFTEMYGLPLTIYFLTQWLGNRYPVLTPFSHNNGHLWLVLLGLSNSGIAMVVLHLVSNAIIFLGFYLLYAGWSLIYKSEGKHLVTTGVYSHVRHPQYVGLLLITVGFLIQWPTLITLILWPFLIYAYYRLAKREEAAVSKQFPEEFAAYKAQVPAFFPRISNTKNMQPS
jgi:protein-S-isoprenylcysteine O-methyltransferase Ste14